MLFRSRHLHKLGPDSVFYVHAFRSTTKIARRILDISDVVPCAGFNLHGSDSGACEDAPQVPNGVAGNASPFSAGICAKACHPVSRLPYCQKNLMIEDRPTLERREGDVFLQRTIRAVAYSTFSRFCAIPQINSASRSGMSAAGCRAASAFGPSWPKRELTLRPVLASHLK